MVVVGVSSRWWDVGGMMLLVGGIQKHQARRLGGEVFRWTGCCPASALLVIELTMWNRFFIIL